MLFGENNLEEGPVCLVSQRRPIAYYWSQAANEEKCPMLPHSVVFIPFWRKLPES